MKLAFLVLSISIGISSAFVAGPSRTTTTVNNNPTIALNAVSMPQKPDNINKDNWSEKPLHVRKDTNSVTDSKFSNKFHRMTMKDVVIPPDYSLTYAIGLLGPLIMSYHPSYTMDGSPSLIGLLGGGFHLLFATLLWVQTSRVRCVFEKDAFEFYNVKGPRLDYENHAHGNVELVRKPNNYVSDTPNRWKYDSIINYGFFPSEDFPVICYFKETETPEYKWDRWFAAFDSYGRGQPHFFPGICNVKQFKKQMEIRGAKRKPIPSLKSTAANEKK